MEVTTLSVQVKSDGIDQATKSLDALGSQAERTEKSVGKLTEKLANTSATFAAIKASLNEMKAVMALSFPTDGANELNKAMKELSSTLATIKGKNFKIDIGTSELVRDTETARKGVKSLNQAFMEGTNVFQMVGKSFYDIRNMLGGTMLASALVGISKASIELADSWTLANAKLSIFVGGTTIAASSQDQLYASSQRLKVPLGDLTTLYTRLVPAMAEYGYNTKDALAVTETMASALKVSGATGAETSSVMLQFSQAMASGRLAGQEFNAISEGAPIVLRAMSDALGVTRGELKKMAADGLLPTTVLTEVLMKKQAEWTKQAEEMPLTVGAAFDQLTSSTAKFLGKLNEGTGVTGLLAKGIKLVGDNLSNLANIAGVALTTWLAYNAAMAVYNTLVIGSAAMTATLAAELGMTAVATGAAGGAMGLLNGALAFLLANPIVLTLTAIAAAMAAVYLWTEKAADAKTRFNELNAKGDTAGASKVLEEQANSQATAYSRVASEIERISKEKEIAAKAGANTSAQTEQLAALNAQLTKIGDGWNKAKKELTAYQDQLKVKAIDPESDAIKERLSEAKQELVLKRSLTKAEKDLAQMTKMRDKLAPDMVQSRAKYDADIKGLKEIVAIEEQARQAKKADKVSESFDKKYDKEISSLRLFMAAQNEELGLNRKLSEAEKEVLKVEEFITANKDKLSAARIKDLRAMEEQIKANGEEIKFRKDVLKIQDTVTARFYKEQDANIAVAESIRTSTEALKHKIELQQDLNQEVPTSALAEQMYAVEMNKATAAAIQQTIELKQTALAMADVRAQMASSPEEMAAAQKEVEMLKEKIDSLKNQQKVITELLPLQAKMTEQLSIAAKKQMLDIGRTPGQILAEGFGEAGAAIAKMSEAYKTFGDDMTKVDKYVADQKKMLADKGQATPDNLAKVDKEVADKRIQINAQMYGSLAGAAKGFFTENSKGYQAMAKAEKAFRVVELALAAKSFIQKMFFTTTETGAAVAGAATKGVAETTLTSVSVGESLIRTAVKAKEAVVGAFVGIGPTGFVTGAAMIALLAALGFTISGGGGGGKTAPSSEETQKAQGAGTVFGDSGAKSESLTKALENISKNSDISLQYNEGMLNALKNIEASMVGVTKQVIRQGVQGQVGFAEGMGTMKPSTLTKMFDPANVLFSVKKSVVDSGLIQNAQAFADIASSGLAIKGYTDIETKRKKFLKTDKTINTDKSDLSKELQDQFTSIVTGIGDSISQAAKALGMDGESFTNTLESFVVDIGRISIQGMDAKQIQETLTNVFSKLGDDMATAVLPGLQKFQNIGEGYLETLTRVATTVATVDGIFGQFGVTFDLTGIQAVDAKMKIAELAGGLEGLSSKIASFADHFMTESEKQANKTRIVTEEFKRLGVAMIDLNADDARIQFRDLVLSFKDGNQEVFNSLLNLEGIVNDLTPAFKETAKAVDLTNQKLSQQDTINQLTMTSSQYLAYQRQKELDAMDESLRPMQQRIYALQDEAKITEQKTTLEDTYNKLALSGTALLTYNRNLELAKMDESLRPLQMRIYALQDEKTALEDMKKGASGALAILDKSVVAQKKILKDDLDGKILNINSAKDAEDARFEAEKAKLEATKTISDEYYATQQEAAANAVTSIKEYRDELKTLFDDISGAVDKITNNNKQLQAISYNAAKAQLDSVLATAKSSGQLPDSKSFKDVLDSLTSLSESDFSTMLDFQREQLVSAGKLSQLGGVAGGKLSAAESAVLAAEANVKATKDAAKEAADRYTEETKSLEDKHKVTTAYYDSNIKALQTQYDLDVEFYDKLLQNAKDQLDIANGTYIATIGVRDAVDYFGTALGMYVAAKDAEQARLVEQVNQMGLKTTGYEDALAKQESDKQALVTEMAGLREDLAAQNKAIATNTLATAKVLQRWDGDGQPEVRNVA